MSTVRIAPERPPLPLNGNKSSGHRPRANFLSRQVICALVLILTDLSAIAISLELAILTRRYFVPHVDAYVAPSTFPFLHYLSFGWLWLVPLIFFSVEGLYTRRRSQWNEVGYLIKAVALSLIAMLAALALTQLNPLVSRTTILFTAVNLFVLLPIVRYWTKHVLGKLGPWRKRILILGATDMAVLAMRGLAADTFLGYEVAGVLDDNSNKKGNCLGACNGTPIHILGNLSEAREQMERTHSRDVLIAMPALREEKLLALVHELQPCCDSIYVVPQVWGLPMMNLQVDGFLRERVMMLKLSNNLAKPWNVWLKRGFDLLLGTALTLIALPIFIVVAILVKLESKGPALFVQERLGYRGRNFLCLKFRTMRVDGEEVLGRYLESNPQAMVEWQKYAKLRQNDPRLTRLGGFLRRWSLDELPQLFNVITGEMSLVGPRPYLPHELDRIGVDLPTILSARPGMTGFWQVSGRNQLTLEDRVKLEAWYVRNWTPWLDGMVFAKTFRVVLFPENGLQSQNAAGSDSPGSRDSTFELVSSTPTTKSGKSRHHSAGAS
jgi:Undecaprenyl-phosphate galactose phosphotransferase WbaP